jgi:hypothetical protein
MTNHHVILDLPYQGNGWWAILGLGSLFMLSRILLGVRGKRTAGLPVDIRTAVAKGIFFLGLFALAVFQVLSHQW